MSMKRTISKSTLTSFDYGYPNKAFTNVTTTGTPRAKIRMHYERSTESEQSLDVIPQSRKVCYKPRECPRLKRKLIEDVYEPQTPPHVLYCSSSTIRSSDSEVSICSDPGPGAMKTDGRLNSVGVYQILLDFIEEMQHYVVHLSSYTFEKLAKTINAVPDASIYVQWIIAQRLVSLPCHLLGKCVDYVKMVICDEDLVEVTVGELACFLHSICDSNQKSVWVVPDVFADLYSFFKESLVRFKHFLTNLWLYTDRISRPCEFGKRSATVFLCMECNQEHR